MKRQRKTQNKRVLRNNVIVFTSTRSLSLNLPILLEEARIPCDLIYTRDTKNNHE